MHRTAVDQQINYVRSEKQKRNLITIWLDYRKAFDSVPYKSQWCTILHLNGEEEVIVSDIIYFVKGIFQGDSLFVLLFIFVGKPTIIFIA